MNMQRRKQVQKLAAQLADIRSQLYVDLVEELTRLARNGRLHEFDAPTTEDLAAGPVERTWSWTIEDLGSWGASIAWSKLVTTSELYLRIDEQGRVEISAVTPDYDLVPLEATDLLQA